MALTPGTRFASYELGPLLGSGGMGEVYRAKDVRLGRPVAIKVLRPESASSPERLARFEQEARTASALNHPNVITIYDIGRVDETPYIAMESRGGEDVPRAARARPPARAAAPPLRDPDRGSPGQGPRRGHRAPGPQAREPHGHERRPGEDPRLRPREADAGGLAGLDRRRRRADRRRHPAGHGAVHVAGAGADPFGGPPLRPVHAGDDPLRDGHRPAGLSPRLRERDARRDHVRRARAGGRHQPGRPRGPPARHRHLPSEGAPEALRDHERSRPRPLGPAGRAGGLRQRADTQMRPAPGAPSPRNRRRWRSCPSWT